MTSAPDAPPPPDLGDLARRVEALHTQIAEVEASMRHGSRGVSSEIDEVKSAILDMLQRLEKLEPEPAPAAEKPKLPPAAWVDYASPQQWKELAEWVDWLARTYEVRTNRAVLPCWPAHLGVAEELAGLWQAWLLAATAARGKKPTDAMIYWHDRWLWPTLPRLREVTAQHQCADQHAGSRPGRMTAPELLAEAVAAAELRCAASDEPPPDDEPPPPDDEPPPLEERWPIVE